MKLPSFLRQTNNNFVNLFVGISLILVFIINCYWTFSRYFRLRNPLNSYEYSEFLINFQGGFVRRGLLGEFLYQVHSYIDYPLFSVITTICFGAFFFSVAFFFYKFYKNQYCWWILLSPLFLGEMPSIVRKDYILYCLLIAILYVLQDVNLTVIRRLLACALVTLGLFLHEAFIFWGFPIYAIIIFCKPHNARLKWIFVTLPLITFALLSISKGNVEVAHQIVDSWNSVLPGQPLTYTYHNSIGAIGWETINTFKFHLVKNASKWGSGIFLIPMYLLAGYYMFTNFLSVFGNQSLEKKNNNKLALSLVYSLTALCMVPMFTVLSCDTGRNFQYISVVTFATFLIISPDDIVLAFPAWYKRLILKFNQVINDLVPPNKVLMVILLLFLGMTAYYFSIQTCLSNSVIGTLLYVIKYFV